MKYTMQSAYLFHSVDFLFSLLLFSYFLMYYSLNRVSKLFISGDKNYLQKFRAHFSNWKLLILEGICISIFIHFSLAGGKKDWHYTQGYAHNAKPSLALT